MGEHIFARFGITLPDQRSRPLYLCYCAPGSPCRPTYALSVWRAVRVERAAALRADMEGEL